MRRFPNLRTHLLRLVMAALPAAAGAGCLGDNGDGDPCREYREMDVVVAEPPPAELQPLVEACLADAEDCAPLCQAVLEERTGLTEVESCEVEHRAAEHVVRVGYSDLTGEAGCPVPGRRPSGLLARGMPRAGEVGAWLARAAWMEAASVHAFVVLARDLRAHGAPDALVRSALHAAHDEIRHAAVMAGLARAHGARVPPVSVAPPRPRTLEDVAVENAVEGCVGEAWAAVVALWQAGAAGDPAVREAMRAIAGDEAGHASLAFAIDGWCRGRLAPAAHARVRAAGRDAVARLAERVAGRAPSGVLVDRLGLPGSGDAGDLLARVRGTVWS